MGSQPAEQGRYGNEGPEHRVMITRPFLVSAVPVTQALWQTVMDDNPSHFKGSRRPVERISWYDAVAFCNALSKIAGLPDAYVFEQVDGRPGSPGFRGRVRWVGPGHDGFRMLTEAEWEFCARGGPAGASGSNRAFMSHRKWLSNVAWYSANSERSTHPVGQLNPHTSTALRDMLGNVAEWVWDVYCPYSAQQLPTGKLRGIDQIDPVGPFPGKNATRCIRGGSWATPIRGMREAFRGALPPHRREKTVGLRIARSICGG